MIIMRLERTMIQYGMASIPVMIGSTQKSATGDMLHMCCTECDSKVSQKNFCSNESCSLHEVIPNARNSTNRYIDLDKENRKILKQEELKAFKEEGSVIQVEPPITVNLAVVSTEAAGEQWRAAASRARRAPPGARRAGPAAAPARGQPRSRRPAAAAPSTCHRP